MDNLIELWETPQATETYMIIGWQQWADAGSISSGLPQYLINKTEAKKIGEIKPNSFYLFQIPGTHHFLRPEINLNDGYPESLSVRKNEIFYTGNDDKGLIIFMGTEPHLNADRYAQAVFEVAKKLGVKRIAGLGGVYGAIPFDKDREISCAYSMKRMKAELDNYAVRFSNYEGGATIGSYLLNNAKQQNIEFCVFYAFVPAYDFSELSAELQSVRIENDYKAWYDLMHRLNYMFKLGLDLSELEEQSHDLIISMNAKIEEMERTDPNLNIKAYLQKITDIFVERPFMPLDDVWERELGDLFGDNE